MADVASEAALGPRDGDHILELAELLQQFVDEQEVAEACEHFDQRQIAVHNLGARRDARHVDVEDASDFGLASHAHHVVDYHEAQRVEGGGRALGPGPEGQVDRVPFLRFKSVSQTEELL